MKYVDIIQKWVNEVTIPPHILEHYKKTLEYVLILCPNADRELKIAALTHDIERCFANPIPLNDFQFDDIDYLLMHGHASAEIVKRKLIEIGFDGDTRIVESLVSYHEVGGFWQADILKDADSLSYLEVLPSFGIKIWGKEIARSKINYMYARISTSHAKTIAKKYFDKSIRLCL